MRKRGFPEHTMTLVGIMCVIAIFCCWLYTIAGVFQVVKKELSQKVFCSECYGGD